MLLALLLVAVSTAPSLPRASASPRAGLLESLRARESFVRTCTVDCVSASTIARAPLALERTVATFDAQGGERWTRYRLDDASCGGFEGAVRPPLDLLARLRARAPETVSVYDGNATLEIARRIEVEGWSGALKPGLPPGARRGALHAAGLMYDDRWLSDVLCDLELVRVDPDVSKSAQRVWLFSRTRARDRVEAHVLVTSNARADLVLVHRANELERLHYDTALEAHAPGVALTWTSSGTTFEASIEAEVELDGTHLPLRARTPASVAWFTFRTSDEGVAAAFDARRAPPEAGDEPLSVVDATTLEPLDYSVRP